MGLCRSCGRRVFGATLQRCARCTPVLDAPTALPRPKRGPSGLPNLMGRGLPVDFKQRVPGDLSPAEIDRRIEAHLRHLRAQRWRG